MAGFRITDHKGFQITFDNGWTVSVQFGITNYCSHHNGRDYFAPQKAEIWESPDAEIAAWDENRYWFVFEDDQLKGYVTANEVLTFMAMIAAK